MSAFKGAVFLRALAVWLIIMLAEVIHGTLRNLFFAPRVGDFKARQVAVFTGSVIIQGIAMLFIRWIGAVNTRERLGVGLLWVVLTLVFEFVLGRLVLSYSWERMLSDYNIAKGGMMPIGLLVMALSLLVAGKVRTVK